MKYKYEKCEICDFNNRQSTIFPRSECKEAEQVPVTCYECIHYQCGGRKSIRPCKKFEWD